LVVYWGLLNFGFPENCNGTGGCWQYFTGI
jgi:hypothetical protein